MEGSYELQCMKSWFWGEWLFRAPFPFGSELMGPYPEHWTKWFEWKVCRKGLERAFEMPTILVWSVWPIWELSAAATFPNEKELLWTFAEGKLYAGCRLGCWEDAGMSSALCSISFCVQKRRIKCPYRYWHNNSNSYKKRNINMMSVLNFWYQRLKQFKQWNRV